MAARQPPCVGVSAHREASRSVCTCSALSWAGSRAAALTVAEVAGGEEGGPGAATACSGGHMPGAYVSAKILGGGCMEEASAVQVPKGLLEGGVAGSMGGLSGWPRRDVAGASKALDKAWQKFLCQIMRRW
eukprot:1158656-Pelagomonas_calceolata.AAC.12